MDRRQFIRRGVMGAAALAAIEGFVREPRHPVGEEIEIRLKRLPDAFEAFRIAQISDIHFGPYMDRQGVERGVQLARGMHPDLLVLTGDFVSHSIGKANGLDGARHAEPCADVIAQWKDMPKIAILGNHDHWNNADLVAGALVERNIRVLRNGSTPIERAGSRLWIAGVDDALVGLADMPKTLKGIPATEATVLLAHEPDYADYAAKFPVDLQLSGHSHGGQVRIPGVGPIVLPEMAAKYHTGLNRVGEMQVYTNWGLGVITPPVRLLCPAKVTLITLRRSLQ